MTCIASVLQHYRHCAMRIRDTHSREYVLANLKPLLSHVLDRPLSYLLSHDEMLLSQEQLHQFSSHAERLLAGTPLPYITGWQEFWSLPFLVNEHTLIPRPDTEVLVETILKKWGHKETLSVCDMGTGSGCIAISLKKERPNWQVRAVERSVEALTVATENAERLGVEIAFFQGGWYQALPQEDKYDIIVSNPPYIEPTDTHLSALMQEPITALVAQDAGMADLCHLIHGAYNYLTPSGILVLEHGYHQGCAVRQELTRAGFGCVQTIKDYGDNDRVTYAVGQ